MEGPFIKKDDVQTTASSVPLADTDFITEKIKQRPLNRKKFLRRTMITVLLAAIFGLVACLTFLILQPFINRFLFPEPEPAIVTFPEEAPALELQPQDMFTEEPDLTATEEIEQALNDYRFSESDYAQMYLSMKSLARERARSLVTVTAITSGTDWINNPFEQTGSASGVIVADNGSQIFILTGASAVDGAESIRITFGNGSSLDAQIQELDTVSGFAVLTVPDNAVSGEKEDIFSVAKLGSSLSLSLVGSPVIAIGSPTGVQGSVCYGAITSPGRALDLPDSNYKLLTTDICAPSSGSGVLIDLTGNVVGVIDMSHREAGQENLLCAVGITELKGLIEKLSNASPCAYLGIHSADVPAEIRQELAIPPGAYVTRIEMNSPAMDAGIQSGDVITAFNGADITGYDGLIAALREAAPEERVLLTLLRQGASDYTEMHIYVLLDSATTG